MSHPWDQGYSAAREVRQSLGLKSTAKLDTDGLVPRASVAGASAGLQGYALKPDSGEGIALALPVAVSTTTTRFAQARTLGLTIFGGNRRKFLLDPAHSDLTKSTRAFAAELLAPADGIAEMMGNLPGETEGAFEAIARRFNVSPLLIRCQYENQVLAR